MRRATAVRTISLHAECHGCDWSSRDPNALANAARHHDATGHLIDIETVRMVRYGDPATAIDPAQTSILDDGQAA